MNQVKRGCISHRSSGCSNSCHRILSVHRATISGPFHGKTWSNGSQTRSEGLNTMRYIIQIIDGFATEVGSGGASLFGIQLARAINRYGLKTMVYGLWNYDHQSQDRWLKILRYEGIHANVIVHRKTSLVVDLVKAATLLSKYIPQDSIVHSHFERGDLLSLYLHNRIRCPLVRTMHTSAQWQRRVRFGRMFQALQPLFWHAEVAISSRTKITLDNRMLQLFLGKKSTVIRNGLPEDVREQIIKYPEIRRVNENVRFAIIGRLEEQKGHLQLLDALPSVIKKYPKSEFWFIGEGSLRNQIETKIAFLGLHGNVRLFGAQFDIPRYLKSTDCLIVPSLWEGFPTVVIEAFTASIPVIATRVSGNEEMIVPYQNGLLYEVGDVSSLSQSIIWMIEHPQERVWMGRVAFSDSKMYSFNEIAHQYIQIYSSIINRLT